MIKLTKLDETDPQYGAGIAWLSERKRAYREARERNENCTRFSRDYANARVKNALKAETYAKCAYCESPYVAVAHGDVEHIRPTHVDPEGLLDYDNLTIACPLCNNKKRGYHNPEAPLLHPYTDDPERLNAYGTMLLYKPGADIDGRARNTIERLHLNRVGLLQARGEVVTEVLHLVDTCITSSQAAYRSCALRTLARMCADDAQYSRFARRAVTNLCPELADRVRDPDLETALSTL